MKPATLALLLALSLAVPALAAERKPAAPARAEAAETADPKALLATLEARLGEGEKLSSRLSLSVGKVDAAVRKLQDIQSEAFLARDQAALDQVLAGFDAASLRAGLDDLSATVQFAFWKNAELAVPANLGRDMARLAPALGKLDKALKPDPKAAAHAVPVKRVMALQTASNTMLPPLFPLLDQIHDLRARLDRASLGWRSQIDSLRLLSGTSSGIKITPPIEDKETARIREAIEKESRKEVQP